MLLATALGQLARMIGPAFRERLGVPADAPFPDELALGVHKRVLALAAAYAEEIAQELAAEASASDDVQDADSAASYLEDRLRFFGPLLTEQTRERIRERFKSATRPWVASDGR